MTHKAIGNQGESIAEAYLEAQGFVILAKQYRYKQFELDLIAHDLAMQEIVFVEVKMRKSEQHGSPEEAVTAKKQRYLIQAAEAYLYETDQTDHACRFDVIAIIQNQEPPIIRHYQDAFWAR